MSSLFDWIAAHIKCARKDDRKPIYIALENFAHRAQPKEMMMTNEHILVVKRATLLHNNSWHGLNKAHPDTFIAAINEHKEFLPRAQMETNPLYKQIIPYLIFKHNDRYFLMQRQSKASEQRLKNKYTFGIGGHIRQEDMTSNTIFDWAQREFHEEVTYNGKLTITPVGMLNDDTNEVGRVHIGLVLLLEGDSNAISVKSELKGGTLLTIKECKGYYDSMETWSQLLFDYLKQ